MRHRTERNGFTGFAVALGTFALVAMGCRPPITQAEKQWRSEREQAVRSALSAEAAARFAGVRFFPYDHRYRVKTMMEPVSPPEPLRLAASDGSVRPAHRVGRVRVTVPAGEAVLSVFQLDDIRDRYPDHLFLPFRDAGAGRETYGAGRYVEVGRAAGGMLEIDFNRSYNPDCAYGITAQCPITPTENTLPFLVEAGEMMPAGH